MSDRLEILGHRRSFAGQSLIELAAGIIVLVPVALFLLDISMTALISSKADALAKSAARAAANESDSDHALQVANQTISKYLEANRGLIDDIKVVNVDYQPNRKVAVRIEVSMHVPAPIPFMESHPLLNVQAVEPIVALSR